MDLIAHLNLKFEMLIVWVQTQLLTHSVMFLQPPSTKWQYSLETREGQVQTQTSTSPCSGSLGTQGRRNSAHAKTTLKGESEYDVSLF